MNNLMTVPQALQLSEERKDRYGYSRRDWYTVTPYKDNEWQKKIGQLGLTIPFDEIVTMDMGKSKCPDCGAVYEGHAPLGCIAIVYKIDPKNTHYSYYKFSHQYSKNNKTEICGARVVWDLQKEFEEQQDFFSFLAMLCNTVNVDWFDKYKHVIPAERIDEFRVKTLLYELMETQRKTQDALNQIASKMTNAGLSLQF